MELKQYLSVIIKWWWLIVLATAVAALSSYIASGRAQRVYQTSTTLMVGQTIQDPNPNTASVWTSQQLAQTYVQMARRQPVLQAVVESLGLNMPWQALRAQVSAVPIAGTQLLEIRVVDTNPQRAKVLADEVARQLILQSPTPSEKQQEEHRQFVNDQLNDLRQRIEQARLGIQELERSLGGEVSARRIQDIQSQIAAKQSQMNIWQTNYSTMLTYARGGSNYLSVVEPATVPTWPISPNSRLNMLLAAAIGMALAVGAAFLIEYLDDTIKNPDDVQRVLNSPTLGSIARIAPVVNASDVLVAAHHPKSSIAEAYRILRTNIQFAGVDNPATGLLVTSAGPQEGKSTTLANLGVVMAQAGKRTLLVDTDLRRPILHELLELPNKYGLTNLLLVDSPDIAGAVQETKVPGLSVLTCGPQPPNPAELLASKRMDGLIAQLKASFDVVLYDSPPALAVTDATILASKVGEAMLVVDAGRTRGDASKRAAEAIKSTGAQLLGVAVNRLSPGRSGYGYYYYSYYYSSDGETRRKRRRRKPQGGFSLPFLKGRKPQPPEARPPAQTEP